MRKSLFFIVFGFAFASTALAQDTLPRVSVKNIGNQIIVSWKNNYGAIISNINIQRSRDSLKNFTTIGTVLNPLNKENGFVDRKPNNLNMYYRVFVAFEGGTYLFSLSHHPVLDTTHTVTKVAAEQLIATEPTMEELIQTDPANTAPVSVAEEKALVAESLENFLPKIKIPKIVVPIGFVPSKFIYTNKENNLVISLPDAETQKFSVKFFDDKDNQVLEIKKITESFLLMEKVNFMHTGWFYYSLYDDNIFLEKYKFYIGKEGRVGPPPPETRKPTKNVGKQK